MPGKRKKRGPRKNKPTIWHAAREGNVADVDAFVTADPNCINEVDNLGWAPLHYACLFGRREVVHYLVEKGADINMLTEGIIIEKGGVCNQTFALTYMGVTPLIISVRKGFNALVSELLRGGADPGVLDLIGQSAVDYANAKTRAILNFESSTEPDTKEEGEEEEEEAEDQ